MFVFETELNLEREQASVTDIIELRAVYTIPGLVCLNLLIGCVFNVRANSRELDSYSD